MIVDVAGYKVHGIWAPYVQVALVKSAYRGEHGEYAPEDETLIDSLEAGQWKGVVPEGGGLAAGAKLLATVIGVPRAPLENELKARFGAFGLGKTMPDAKAILGVHVPSTKQPVSVIVTAKPTKKKAKFKAAVKAGEKPSFQTVALDGGGATAAALVGGGILLALWAWLRRRH